MYQRVRIRELWVRSGWYTIFSSRSRAQAYENCDNFNDTMNSKWNLGEHGEYTDIGSEQRLEVDGVDSGFEEWQVSSEVGASRAEIGLPKMLQRDVFLDMNGILCRSRTVGRWCRISRDVFRDLGLPIGNASYGYRGMNASYHGWGPILEMSVLRREEKHGGRVKEDFMDPNISLRARS